MSRRNIRRMAFAALFGVLTAAGAYIIIPLPFSPVPITGQTFFVLLSGLLLGPELAASAVFVYLAIGLAGFPVFAGGMGGVGVFFGPTGGYLLGFLASAYVTGYFTQFGIQRRGGDRYTIYTIAVVIGTGVIYLIGLPWLAIIAELSPKEAFAIGVIPFLIGDIIKALAAVLVARTLWSTISFGLPRGRT